MSGIDQITGAALAGVLNSLWIALALAIAAWTLARFLPRTNAATRHLLWWAVLALVLMVPFAAPGGGPVRGLEQGSDRGATHSPAVTAPPSAATSTLAVVTPPLPPARAIFPLRLEQGSDRGAAHGPAVTVPRAPAATAPAVNTPSLPPARAIFPLRIPGGVWLGLAMALWALFAFMQLFRIAWSFGYLRQVKRGAHAAPEAIDERFRYWVAASAIRRPVRLLISGQIASPLATGFRHPAVILPAPLLAQFAQGELDHALLHELAHVARRDDWTNLLARCLGAIAGLHPVAAWAMRRIARERELAADDWVVSRTGAARPYAASLARLFELCRSRRRMVLAAGMAGSASHLGERIETLLHSGRQFSGRASMARVALTATALLALVAAGARAPRWIVLAQSPAAPAHDTPRPDTPVNPRGSFLAALVAAGYGNLPVDEIISLKDHGIDARFLAGISQSGWERMTADELIQLHDHGVPPEMLRALRDAGFQHLRIREAIDAFEKGVRQGTLREAAEYGTHLTLAQIVKLKQSGVIQ